MLDILTIFILLIGTFFTISCVLFVLWLATRPARAPLWWAGGFLVCASGVTLLAARGRIADWASIELANTLLLLGVGLFWAGVREFDRRPIGLWLLLPAALWLALVPWPVIGENIAARVALVSAGLALGSLMIGRELWRSPGERLLSRKALAVVFLLQATASLARGSLALVYGVPDDLFAAGDWFAFSLLQPVFVVLVLVMIGILAVMERRERLVRQHAEIDSLTGVLHRGGFITQAGAAIVAARRQGQPVGLVLFDLDHFKQINDAYGHLAGDAVLVAFCAIATASLRPTDIFGRIGGEEFAALLPGITAGNAEKLAERIRETFHRHRIERGELSVGASVSAGISVLPGEMATLDLLVAAADRALYRAKAEGRNRIGTSLSLAG